MDEKVNFEIGYKYEKMHFIAYPIRYKEKKYHIELSKDKYGFQKIYIYSYREKRSIFREHKGKLVFSYNGNIVNFNLNGFNDFEEFKLQIPNGLKRVFDIYEKRINKLKEAENWDGVIR